MTGSLRRVCVVTPTFPLGDTTIRGGTNTYAETLCRALATAGLEVHVVVYDMPDIGNPEVDYPWRMHFVKLPYIPYLSTLLPGLIQSWKLRRFLQRLDARLHFDVIEGSNYEGWLLFTAWRFGRRFWMRCHTSLGHCIREKGLPLSWGRAFSIWLDRAAVRCSRQLVTHSQHHAHEMTREYGVQLERIRIVPHGVAINDTTAHRQPGDTPSTFGYIGSLDRRKGIDILLEAIPTILDRHPEARFFLVGYDGQDSPASSWKDWFFDKYPSPRYRQQVRFFGYVPDSELLRLWEEIDFIVVPSRYESFGYLVVEGFARGKPVIASRGGALPEVAGEAALLVKDGDPADLARAALRLLKEPGVAAQLVEAGAERYARHYTLQRFTENMLSLYQSGQSAPPSTPAPIPSPASTRA